VESNDKDGGVGYLSVETDGNPPSIRLEDTFGDEHIWRMGVSNRSTGREVG
jgi:hypothetical protein